MAIYVRVTKAPDGDEDSRRMLPLETFAFVKLANESDKNLVLKASYGCRLGYGGSDSGVNVETCDKPPKRETVHTLKGYIGHVAKLKAKLRREALEREAQRDQPPTFVPTPRKHPPRKKKRYGLADMGKDRAGSAGSLSFINVFVELGGEVLTVDVDGANADDVKEAIGATGIPFDLVNVMARRVPLVTFDGFKNRLRKLAEGLKAKKT